MRSPSDEPIIVCPLTFERDSLAGSGVSGRILCIGPGSHGVERLASMIQEKPGGPVILAGLAGALDPAMAAGSAYIIGKVVGNDGAHWMPNWCGQSHSSKTTIAASSHVLTNIEMKRTFSKRTTAQLVDQESEAFARLASERDWTWGIVRGVSDDHSTSLPRDIDCWVTDEGATRISRVLLSLARRPQQVGAVMALQRHSKRAMTAVAALLRLEFPTCKADTSVI